MSIRFRSPTEVAHGSDEGNLLERGSRGGAPMYFFTLLTFAVFGYGFFRRSQLYRLGKRLNRLDQLPRRISLLLRYGLSQSKVLRVMDRAACTPLSSGGSGCSSSGPC